MYPDYRLDEQLDKLYRRIEECIEDRDPELALTYATLVKELELAREARRYKPVPVAYYTYPPVIINPCPPSPFPPQSPYVGVPGTGDKPYWGRSTKDFL